MPARLQQPAAMAAQLLQHGARGAAKWGCSCRGGLGSVVSVDGGGSKQGEGQSGGSVKSVHLYPRKEWSWS